MNEKDSTGHVPGGESVPGANAPAEPETARVVRVRVDAGYDEMRLRWARRGVTGDQIIWLPATCPGITGMGEDGIAYLSRHSEETYFTDATPLSTARAAIADGRDVETAIRAYYTDIAERKAKHDADEAQRKAASDSEEKAWADAISQYTLRESIRIERSYGSYSAVVKVGEVACRETIAAPTTVAIADAIQKATARAAHEAAEDERRRAAKQAVEGERAQWIADHGSADLQRRVARGYDCARLYYEERLAMELGDAWTLSMWDGRPDWDLQERSCPTDEALRIEDEAAAKNFSAKTYWAKWDQRYDEESYACEVVVVEDFHSRQVYAIPTPSEAPPRR